MTKEPFKSDAADSQKHERNQIWCVEYEHFKPVSVCRQKCKDAKRCKAYQDYLSPKMI